MKTILAIIFLLFCLSRVEAATYWVSPSGTSGGCIPSTTQPPTSSMQSTVNGGVSCLAPGDTLNLMPGTYSSQTIWSIRNNPGECSQGVCPPNGPGTGPNPYTTIQAAPGFELQATLSLPGDKLMRMQGYVKYLAIKNLRLDASQGVGSLGGMVNGDCAGPLFDCKTNGVLDEEKAPHHITFEGNELFGPPDYVAKQMPSGIHGFGAGSIFRGNHIYNFGHSQFEHGIYTTGDILAENNRIHDIAGYGVQLRRCDASQSGCTQPQIQNGVVRNNLFYNLANAGVVTEWGPHYVYGNSCRDNSKCVQVSYSDNNQIFNNTSWRDSTGCIVVGPGGGNNVVRNNLCMGSHSEGDIFVTTTGDPTFNNILTNNFSQSSLTGLVDPANNNFQLQSPFPNVIDAGLNLSSISLPLGLGQPTRDAANTIRPQGSQWDIGACEWFNGAPVCPNLVASTPPVNPPVVNITSPSSASSFEITTVTVVISGTASATSPATVSKVTWACATCTPTSGTAVGTTTWAISGVNFQVGDNSFTVTATDSTGLIGTDNANVIFVPPFPGNALVGAWGFEEGTGTTVADQSGNSNGGTLLNGATWTTNGKFGNALSLDGVNDFVNVADANSLDFTQSFTFSAWVFPTAVHTDWRAVISKNTTASNYSNFLYASTAGFGSCTSGSPLAGFNTSSATNVVCHTNNPLPINTWTHMAVSYDRATTSLTLYRNGVAVSTLSVGGLMVPGNQPLRIGATIFGEFFHGFLDEVRAYNWKIPLTAGSNTTPGATCVFGNPLDTAQQSIVRDMNCPVIQTTPAPVLTLKLGSSATALKVGPSATGLKFGSKAP